MNKKDLIVGVVFGALAVGLAAAASSFPDPAGRAPGPSFFPYAVATAMGLLSLGVLFQAFRSEGEQETGGDLRAVLAVCALALVYLALWGTGLFALRTAVFLALFLRLVGETWRASATVSVALTAVAVLAFQVGLRVNLE